MGLTAIFEAAAQTIFKVAGDTLVSATYRRVSDSVYDPTTGDVVDTTTDQTVKMHLEEFSAMEINGTNVIRGDLKAMFPVADLSVTPEAKDKVQLRSEWWEVIDAQNEDGALIVWTLHLRRP
jgi:hypothetical protein